jgi:hypothetical protein
MSNKLCFQCKWFVFKADIGMDYCIRPDGYMLLISIESGFVDTRDLPKNYELCGKEKKYWEAMSE